MSVVNNGLPARRVSFQNGRGNTLNVKETGFCVTANLVAKGLAGGCKFVPVNLTGGHLDLIEGTTIKGVPVTAILIIGHVRDGCMRMQMGIEGTRKIFRKSGRDKVACVPVSDLAICASHTNMGIGFDKREGTLDGIIVRRMEALVAADDRQDTDPFGCTEGQIPAGVMLAVCFLPPGFMAFGQNARKGFGQILSGNLTL
nr:hypothetical protein [Kordiimonas pumila]